MGLTGKSVGKNASRGDEYRKKKDGELLVALAGNPNVGKSTVLIFLRDFISIRETGRERRSRQP